MKDFLEDFRFTGVFFVGLGDSVFKIMLYHCIHLIKRILHVGVSQCKTVNFRGKQGATKENGHENDFPHTKNISSWFVLEISKCLTLFKPCFGRW